MKMGAFMLGGLVGAAAVMYFNRNRSWSFAGLSHRTRESVGKMGNAVAATNVSSHKSSKSDWTESGVEEVVDMIRKDPAVKKEVDEILNGSGKSYMTQ